MKHATVSLTLGHGNQKILIRDIQLWSSSNDNNDETNVQWSGKCLCYVDMKKLPLWIYDREQIHPWRCYTKSSTTWNYFNVKLKNLNRSMIAEVKIGNPPHLMKLLYYIDGENVMCRQLSTTMKTQIDKTITNLIANEPANKRKRQAKLQDKKIQFNDILSKLILTGLRLRDIPNTTPGFTKLYKMTFQAAEFTHREDVRVNNYNVPFETLQQTVETLLTLFTKS